LLSAAAAADNAAIIRGAYLAAAAGCDQCHTDSKNSGAPYAGGRVMLSAFGRIATPNITPDKSTGIGAWNERNFEQAIRWGIAPDGTHYVPAFPFPDFARLTNADLADLKAFLDSLQPVTHSVAGAQGLALTERARAAIGVALAGNPRTPDGSANPGHPAIARGAYLVDAVGHCGDCHTPRTWLGAPDRDHYLAGSRGGIWGGGPNITPDPKTGIGNWSTDEIVALLKEGITPDNDFVGGAMAEIVHNTARLTDDDRRAIAAYLKSLPPKAFDKSR
jgi:mono/diheme cytochrome c family protein